MATERFVLDTSALLTLMEDEPGAERVNAVLRTGAAILLWIVMLEALYIVQQERGGAEAGRRYALVRELPAEILWQMDEPTMLVAARFKAQQRVSLADAVIAAVAVRCQATLMHKDPEFEALADTVRLEALPYKTPA